MNPRLTALLFYIPIIFCALCAAALAESPSDQPVPKNLESILDGAHRAAQDKTRDRYRHPLETLEFFEIEPDMTIVEIWPGKGWYTEILAPIARNTGVLYAAHFSMDSGVPYFTRSLKDFSTKLSKNPEIYDQVKLSTLQPPKHLEIAPQGSADRVLTFRNVHNWMKNDQAAAVFNAMFKALKPGGILGVVEHRGNPEQPQDPQAKSGYVTESAVIDMAKKAGFVLLESSEINANPRDTKNHPEGVWTLPPTFRLKDKEREKYLQIGESDRMTLKFRKPLDTNQPAPAPPPTDNR